MVIGLLQVLAAREYLQVRRNVQPAHDSTAKWNDVIHVVTDAGQSSQSKRLCVERTKNGFEAPLWSGVSFRQFAVPDVRKNLVWILYRPSPVIGAMALGVGFAPLHPVLQFARPVLLVPSLVGVWITPAPFGHVREFFSASRFGLGLQALATLCLVTGIEVGGRLRGLAVVTKASVSHFASMCWSMMRRTSSAIEMPSRLASRFKNALCGSVNEIICLVNPVVLASRLRRPNTDEQFLESDNGGLFNSADHVEPVFVVSDRKSRLSVKDSHQRADSRYAVGRLSSRHYQKHSITCDVERINHSRYVPIDGNSGVGDCFHLVLRFLVLPFLTSRASRKAFSLWINLSQRQSPIRWIKLDSNGVYGCPSEDGNHIERYRYLPSLVASAAGAERSKLNRFIKTVRETPIRPSSKASQASASIDDFNCLKRVESFKRQLRLYRQPLLMSVPATTVLHVIGDCLFQPFARRRVVRKVPEAFAIPDPRTFRHNLITIPQGIHAV